MVPRSCAVASNSKWYLAIGYGWSKIDVSVLKTVQDRSLNRARNGWKQRCSFVRVQQEGAGLKETATLCKGSEEVQAELRTLISKARKSRRKGDVDDCVQCLSNGLRIANNGREKCVVLVELGNTYMQSFEFERAAGYFREAMSEDSTFEGAFLGASKCLEKNGEVQDAIAILEKMLCKENEHNSKGLQLLGNLYLKTGDSTNGIKCFQRILSKNPGDAAVWQAWGLHEWRKGKYKSAKDKFERGLEVSPSYSPLLVAYAKMEAQRRNRTKARSLLRQAVMHGPRNPHAWLMYAQLEGRAGNSRQAIKLCNQGLEQFPNNVHLLCTLGQIHESVGESDEAKNAWAKALQVCPSCAVAAYELGSLAWKQGDIESAKKHFSIGIKSRDRKGALRCCESLADMHSFEGDRVNARKIFEQGHKKFKAPDSRFLRAWASFEKNSGNLQRASELYSESASANPRDERTWLQWALLEKRKNNLEKSIGCLEAGLQISPMNPFLWQQYGALVWEMQGPEKGRSIFSKANKQCPRNQQILMEWSLREFRAGEIEEALKIVRLAGDLNAGCHGDKAWHIPLLQLWVEISLELGHKAEHDMVLEVMENQLQISQ